jgi:thioredoxin reductase (NADPH)
MAVPRFRGLVSALRKMKTAEAPAPHRDPALGCWEVAIVGGGLAGLSAALYLARAQRSTLVIDAGRSLAVWEPEVQNYLGFPEGIAGEELLDLGRRQAEVFGAVLCRDEILDIGIEGAVFALASREHRYYASRVLLATGLFHVPPDIPSVDDCLGISLFFCKDCDGCRVMGRRIVIVGQRNEAVEYALGMLAYSACVVIATNGKPALWDEQHAAWIQEYVIPVYHERIVEVDHTKGQLRSLQFANGIRVAADSVFTTRGDLYHNSLAKRLGAKIDDEGQVVVNKDALTSVPGLYAAGCVTPANCQMIIAAGEGATAAQAINRDLFEESLKTHSLRRVRSDQLRTENIVPETLVTGG